MKILKQSIVLSGLIIIFSCTNKKEKSSGETVKKVTATKMSNAWRSFNISTLKITEKGIGKFKIGEIFPSQFSPLKREEKTVIKKTEEGKETVKTNIITSEGQILFAVENDDDKYAKEIMVYTPEIKTVSGLGVGSTLSNIIKIYPDAKVWYTYISDRVVLESLSMPNTQFIIDKKGYKKGAISYNSDKEDLSLEHFDVDTKVKVVRVY